MAYLFFPPFQQLGPHVVALAHVKKGGGAKKGVHRKSGSFSSSRGWPPKEKSLLVFSVSLFGVRFFGKTEREGSSRSFFGTRLASLFLVSFPPGGGEQVRRCHSAEMGKRGYR